MRYSELTGKEIVHMKDGKRLGVLGQTDLLFNECTGEVKAIIIPKGNLFSLRKRNKEAMIYWDEIKTIGSDLILVENEG